MSLVEYGSSDDELDEKNEIADIKEPCSVKEETELKDTSLSSLFASLPKPKHSNARNSDVEESEVKDVNPSRVLPVGCEKKQKQPVKIFIPNLNEFDEDDIPRKRQKSQVSSGLMDILPAPKNTTLGKAADKLVPYVLTKKPTRKPSIPGATNTSRPTPNNKNLALTLVEYDDKDSDDDGGNETSSNSDFFSLNSKDPHTTDSANHILNVNVAINALNANCKTHNVTANYITSELAGYNDMNTSDKSLGNSQNSLSETYNPTNIANTTLDLTIATAEEVRSANTQCIPADNEHNNIPLSFGQDQIYDINVPYSKPQRICEEYNVVHPSQQHKNFLIKPELQENIGAAETTNEIDITDERFLRLQGKKERGKEDIQIIDISADQQLPNVGTALVKSLTEELAYKPSRKKGEMPTSQQRRKHQITYLAFQAKERELELKNQWSTNRMTRRQTQAKYGF